MRRAASAVEFALAVPVLLLVFCGVIDGSWYVRGLLDATLAAQQGARLGAGVRADVAPEAVAVQAARARLRGAGWAVEDAEVVATRGAGAAGQVLGVTVVLPFRPLVGLFPWPPTVTGTAAVDWYGNIGQPG